MGARKRRKLLAERREADKAALKGVADRIAAVARPVESVGDAPGPVPAPPPAAPQGAAPPHAEGAAENDVEMEDGAAVAGAPDVEAAAPEAALAVLAPGDVVVAEQQCPADYMDPSLVGQYAVDLATKGHKLVQTSVFCAEASAIAAREGSTVKVDAERKQVTDLLLEDGEALRDEARLALARRLDVSPETVKTTASTLAACSFFINLAGMRHSIRMRCRDVKKREGGLLLPSQRPLVFFHCASAALAAHRSSATQKF